MRRKGTAIGITPVVLAVATAVYGALDPGLPENAYQACREYELPKHGIEVRRQNPIPIDNRERSSCWLAAGRVR